MEKKILIGSIIIISILIGVSFTTVVGYSSVKSGVKTSPLFNIRIIRAIDIDSKDLNFDYVGKGETYKISVPKRENRAILLQNFIKMIQKMDDKSYEKLKVYLNIFNKNNGRFDNLNLDEIRQMNYLLQDNNSESPLFTMNCEMTLLRYLGLDCLTFALGMMWAGFVSSIIMFGTITLMALYIIGLMTVELVEGWLHNHRLTFFIQC